MKMLRTLLITFLVCTIAPRAGGDPPQRDEPAQPMPIEARQPADAESPPLADITELNLSGAGVEIQTIGGDQLIITGYADDVDILEMFVERLDREGVAKELRILTLENKNAAEVARNVQEIMQKLERRDAPLEEQVSVIAVSNNILLVAAPESKLDQVETIVAAIDAVEASIPPQAPMSFQLRFIKAAEAAAKLDELIKAVRAQQGEAAGTEIQIFPNDANNTLIVVAPAEERKTIQMWIDQIDVEPLKDFGDLKLAYFPLLNSKADELAGVLNELLASSEDGKDGKLQETIRRIRMIKTGPDGEMSELPPINLERPIRLIPHEGTEALICATAEENIEPLQALIELLDGVPMAIEHEVRLFPLVHADAQSLVDMLENMFQKGQDLTKPAGEGAKSKAVPQSDTGEALVYNIGLTADVRTNTIIATGKPKQLTLIESIVEQVDVPSSAINHPLRLLSMENSDATRIGGIIEDLWTKRIEALEARNAGSAVIAGEKIFLAVDIRSNSLIISAKQANFDEIVEIVETLDGAPRALIDQIRIINCKLTSASDLQGKIEELWQRKADLRRENEMLEDLPVIIADQRSNSLVIASSPEDFDEIKRLIDRLESQPLAPIAEIRLLTLENNDASQVGDMLQQLFEERMQQRLVQGQEESPSDRIAIAAEPVTNTLLIASSPDNYDEMVRIINAIDVEPDLEGVVRIFILRNAQADNVAEKIKDLFDQGLYTGAVTGDNQVAQERQKIALISEPRANAIVVSASKTNLAIIEKLVTEMDTADAPMLNADTRLFPLGYADAIKLTDMLDRLFDGMANSLSDDLFKAPTIVPEQRSNTLIVTGTRDAIKRTADLISQLDRQTVPVGAFPRIYGLQHASAVKLAEKMQEIFDKRDEGADTNHTPIFILAEEATNALICSASQEDHTMVTHLLDLLDVPSTISRQVEVFPLKRAKAEPLAQKLESLFESRAQGSGSSGRADVIGVEPDKRTNSLIIWASVSEMQNIREIIERLDTTDPAIEMMVKVIQLKRALAEDFAEILDQTLNGDQSGSGDDAEAVIIQFWDEQDDGVRILRQLIRQDVTINADPRTNSLLVQAPADSMDMLESLILAFDRIPPAVAEIRMFPLANADAEEIVERLTELFEEPTGQEGPETQLALGEGGVAVAGGETSIPGQVLRFTADRRTNVVIAAGSESDLQMVEQLIRQLDAQDVEDRILEVYEARYVPAGEVATALRDFLDEENDLTSELDDESAIRRRAERHVTVIGDEESNSLMIGVSPRHYTRTMEMIYAIDRPPPQVMIQVLIAEVTLNDSLDLGVEFAVQDLSFSEHAVVGPNGTVKGSDFDFVLGTDLGAGSFGGFNFAITGEDFSFLMSALQSDGSLEVLSRPTILVENNEEANITIGDEVPFVASSNVSDSGQVNTNVQYEDVGIILDVTPHINPDGYVNLEIKPEISSLNEAGGIPISEGLTAPTFGKRSAETVVTIKDGETIVIGGLIQTQESRSETKVPILGDIPILGNLFRRVSTTRRRTELLIVLTVDVIRNESDAFAASVKQRDQSGFMPDKMKRSPLMEGLRILPGDSDTDDAQLIRPRHDRGRARPDRQLYGPTPGIYGPTRPGRTRSGTDTASATIYGPPPGSARQALVTQTSIAHTSPIAYKVPEGK